MNRALATAVAGLSALAIPQVDVDARGSKDTGKKRRKRQNRQTNQEAERSVLLLASLAEQVQVISGNCEALEQFALAFQRQHAAERSEIASIEQQLDAATRSKLVTAHETRITQAMESLHTMMTACRFRGAPEAAICATTRGTQTQNSPSFSRLAAAQCGAGCDCSCICPISG